MIYFIGNAKENVFLGNVIVDDICPPMDPMAERAQKLWPEETPHHEHNRREWMRAVKLVRNTKRGWVADTINREPASWPSVEKQ